LTSALTITTATVIAMHGHGHGHGTQVVGDVHVIDDAIRSATHVVKCSGRHALLTGFVLCLLSLSFVAVLFLLLLLFCGCFVGVFVAFAFCCVVVVCCCLLLSLLPPAPQAGP
jgi:hypothetical protein